MKENQSDNAKRLLRRLHDGTITAAEESVLLRWLNRYQHRPDQSLTDESLEQATVELKARLDRYVARSRRPQMARSRYWAAACIALVGIGIGSYLMMRTAGKPDGRAFDHDPGQNRAVLVLEDGREIPLGGQPTDLISTADYEIRQTADSGLVYLSTGLSDALPGEAGGYIPSNTLQTPRGGEYRLGLPDGSVVWLNSDSRITYPVRFGETREVHVVGEAYFQVKRDEQRPFVVHAGNQRIDVLGTEFNVNAYPGQDFTETVLVSGSLRASSALTPHLNVVLKPGEYAQVREHHSVGSGTANVAKITAWRHGDFYFENETLPEIMDVLSRWYDVDVVYDTDLSGKGRFGGVISRDKKLSAVLQMLESTGKVKFKITEKEVVLMD